MKKLASATIMLAVVLTFFTTTVSAAIPIGWVVDRKASATFESIGTYQERSSAIKQSVLGTEYTTNSSKKPNNSYFTNWQGYKKVADIDKNTWTVSSALYISDDMKTGDTVADKRNASIWITTDDGVNITHYIIVGYARQDTNDFESNTGFTNEWFVFNDQTGDYETLSTSHLNTGWHDIDIVYNNGILKYYLDGELVKTTNYTTGLETAGNNQLREYTLNTYNFGADYTVYWATPVVIDAAQVVTKISLNATSKTLETGDTFDLVATVIAETEEDKTVSYTNSTPEVASFDEGTGKVTAIKAGTTTITATAGYKSASIVVTVKDKSSSSGVIVEDKSVTDEDTITGIQIESDTGVVPDGVKLVVESVISGAKYDEVASSLGDVKDFQLFELTLEDLKGHEVQPDGSIKVKIPVPEGYNADNVKIYYIKTDGTKEDMNAIIENIDGVDYAIFITSHFSSYAIVDTSTTVTDENIATDENIITDSDTTTDLDTVIDSEITNPESPKTGDINLILIIGTSIVAISGIVYFTKKMKESKKINED